MTYKEARVQIHSRCKGLGWEVSDSKLKVLWVKRPDEMKFYLKTQSVYIGWSRPLHSTHLDMRQVDSVMFQIENGFKRYGVNQL